MGRFRVVVCILGVAAGYVAGLGVVEVARPRLRAEHFHLVRPGMPRAEVEALLGGPPGDYGRRPERSAWMSCEGFARPGGWPAGSREEKWSDDDCQLEVVFDAGGRVVATHRRVHYHRGEY